MADIGRKGIILAVDYDMGAGIDFEKNTIQVYKTMYYRKSKKGIKRFILLILRHILQQG